MSKWICAIWLILVSISSLADERILDFHSDIRVYSSGEMFVTETITVRSEGNKIRRGIYRDFPTRYKDKFGAERRVDFQLTEVKRDGQRESWHSEKQSNGVRIYMGKSDRTLPRGVHTYRLSYRTDRQLGFYEGFDELYWNVTGNEWEFPIDAASASVYLPQAIGAEDLHLEAYTGVFGAKGADYSAQTNAEGISTFTSTRRLSPGEGLTIVTQWPAGVITRPTQSDEVAYFLADNLGLVSGLSGALLVMLFYGYFWHVLGRDPKSGTIIPRFTPPANMSPAAMRYLMEMGYDKAVVAAAVLNMAVKGFLAIEENSKILTLRKLPTANKALLSTGEKAIAAKLFSGRGSSSITLKNTHHSTISSAIDGLKSHLRAEFDQVCFVTNRWVFVCGLVLTIATIIGSGLLSADEPAVILFMAVWPSIWSFAVVHLWLSGEWLMAAAFSFFEVMALGILATQIGFLLIAIIFILAGINVLFYHLMKAPTLKGRKLMDEIEGFKMYLSTAEQDRLNLLHPPEKTPELFEKYLPYALALGVDHDWAEQFTEVFARASESGNDYAPSWHSSRHWSHSNIGNLASNLGSSLGSSISSASHAPGSSSGGGGGGSSGGGGGGGGGGGW